MLANMIANLPMIFCLLVGAGLIIVEVFLPGFGLPGISGLLLIGAGIVLAALNLGTVTAVGILLVVIAVLALLISLILHYVSRSGRYRSALFLEEKDDLNAREDMNVLLGKTGIARSALRPAGIGDFDGVRLNVVTEGGFIEKDEPIEIIRVDANRIVVRVRQSA